MIFQIYLKPNSCQTSSTGLVTALNPLYTNPIALVSNFVQCQYALPFARGSAIVFFFLCGGVAESPASPLKNKKHKSVIRAKFLPLLNFSS